MQPQLLVTGYEEVLSLGAHGEPVFHPSRTKLKAPDSNCWERPWAIRQLPIEIHET